MSMIGIIIGFVLVLLILLVVYDFIASRKRNRNKFGSDFLFDTIDKGSAASNNKTLDEHNFNLYPLENKHFKRYTGLKKNKNDRL